MKLWGKFLATQEKKKKSPAINVDGYLWKIKVWIITKCKKEVVNKLNYLVDQKNPHMDTYPTKDTYPTCLSFFLN